MNVGAFQAVIRTHGKIHIFDNHSEYLLLLVVLGFHKNIHTLDRFAQIHE